MKPSEILWPLASSLEIALQPEEVHLWLIDFVLSAGNVRGLADYLSPDERAKAARFHFERDREQFIIAHAALRLLLARYCQLEPEQVRFVVNSYGKPALVLPVNQTVLHFNLSHSHGYALVALTRLCEIGVDIEYMRANVEYAELATHCFSRRENVAFGALPEERKAEGFFNAWTRKEAYIKARGMGLSLPLDQFDVSLHPDEPAALLEARDSEQDVTAWSMYALPMPAGYKAALALPARNVSLRCWRWNDGPFLRE
jgi:4'-phosphopantetheinyl transferase